MLRKNLIFSVFAPLGLMIIIVIIVVSIGESLLAMHALGHEVYHVGALATDEANQEAAEQSNLFPVFTALVLALCVLLGGSIATRIAPKAKQQDTHH